MMRAPQDAPRLVERAPAKVNLTLHVRGRRDDGWHDLESLVVFAGVHDLLWLDPGAALALEVEDPTPAAAGPAADNSVLKAARALAARVEGLRWGVSVCSSAFLPLRASAEVPSDAAAALRLLARLNALAPDDPRVAPPRRRRAPTYRSASIHARA